MRIVPDVESAVAQLRGVRRAQAAGVRANTTERKAAHISVVPPA
jgi:hypothetical protein